MVEVRIAVVGAGIAGLACAREVARADVAVTVFEKTRGIGGRLATRREGELAFDHGAQYLTARGQPFLRFIEAAIHTGAVGAWKPRIREDDRNWDAPIDDWYVGIPGMSAALRPMARHVELQTGVGVRELRVGQRGLELVTDGGTAPRVFDAVAVAVPAPQALTLLMPLGRSFQRIAGVRMAPCWTAMMSFDAPLDAGAEVRRWTSGPLTWAACDSSKPGRPGGPQCWVVHASPAWSREHLDADAEDVAQSLWREFSAAVGGALPAPATLRAHRWRHAFVEQPLGSACVVDEESAIGACGDWCVAPRVEAAFVSGRSLARSLLSIVGRATPSLLR
jgi:predicted NAD/FAD-dependent oxidoreductase